MRFVCGRLPPAVLRVRAWGTGAAGPCCVPCRRSPDRWPCRWRASPAQRLRSSTCAAEATCERIRRRRQGAVPCAAQDHCTARCRQPAGAKIKQAWAPPAPEPLPLVLAHLLLAHLLVAKGWREGETERELRREVACCVVS